MAKEFLVKGAVCMCKFGAAPGKFTILDNTHFKINGGKLAGTTLSIGNTFEPPGFGVCKVNPMFPKPCLPAITQWAKPYTAIKTSVGGNPLTEESTATCGSGCPDCITVIQTGQILVPGVSSFQKAAAAHQVDLDPMGKPAGLTQYQISFQPVIDFASYAKEPDPDVEVREIKILTPLEDGSANNGGGNAIRKGMVYDQTYELAVTKFRNGKVLGPGTQVHWGYSFVNQKGVTEYREFSTFILNSYKAYFTINQELLGQKVTFYAYVQNRMKGAMLEQWVHYRFRHFDRMMVEKELDARITHPWKISQGATSLCGMASIVYLLVQTNPSYYRQAILDLHKTGIGVVHPPMFCSGATYVIKPHSDVAKTMYDMNPSDKTKYPRGMPQVDWLALAVIRSQFNFFYGFYLYDGRNESHESDSFRAINWPGAMVTLCKRLLYFESVEQVGMSNVVTAKTDREQKVAKEHEETKKRVEEGNRLPDQIRLEELSKELHKDLKSLLEMERLHRIGYKICMMIDRQMLDNKSSYRLDDLTENMHWVVYEGGLQLLDEQGNRTTGLDAVKFVRFKVFTWGEDLNSYGGKGYLGKHNGGKGISIEAFRSNFYYYIKCKHKVSLPVEEFSNPSIKQT